MRKQTAIIFSSSNSLDIANEISARLKKEHDGIDAVCWQEHFDKQFPKGYDNDKFRPLFRLLTKCVPSFDFAIIVAARDDTVLKNVCALSPESGKINDAEVQNAHKIYAAMRDNVVFELGMCCMAMGESRVILLQQKGVRLFDDLRGLNDAQFKKADSRDDALTIENIQLKAFEYESKENIEGTCNSIAAYIREKAGSYDPVIVGAACSTASGYFGNFINSLVFALKQYAKPDPQKGEVKLDIPTSNSEELLQLCKDLKNLEIHILLPGIEACMCDQTIISNPREISDKLYKNEQYKIISNCLIDEKSRKITFACKKVGEKLYIIDMPTTILASYNTAKKILDIADDTNDSGGEFRYIAKEIDMFNATLSRLLPENEKMAIKCVIDDITFNDDTDKKNISWLYA